MCETTGCQTRKVAGINLTRHVETCRWAPLGDCANCGHPVVRDELTEHEGCDISEFAELAEAAPVREVMAAA